MLTLLTKTMLIVSVNLAAGVAYLSVSNFGRDLMPWETDAALYAIPHGQQSEVLLLGSSHAAVFGHCPDAFASTQSAFGDDVVLIGKRGSGILQHHLLLREYYRRGNSADRVIYCLDMWGFYDEKWNETVQFIEAEPFDATFMLDLAAHGVSTERLYRYVRSKFSREWFSTTPRTVDKTSCSRRLARRSQLLINAGMQNRFPNEPDPALRDKYLAEFTRFIKTVESNGAELILVTQPTFLDRYKDADTFTEALHRIVAEHGVSYHDHSRAIDDVSLFHDHDHLNDAGVRTYTNQFVLPALNTAAGK